MKIVAKIVSLFGSRWLSSLNLITLAILILFFINTYQNWLERYFLEDDIGKFVWIQATFISQVEFI